MLSRLYRRLFLTLLQAAFDQGQLRFFADLAALATPAAFAAQLRRLHRISRVVYAKPPFGGPEQVLAYLGRYTQRVAIANSRPAHRAFAARYQIASTLASERSCAAASAAFACRRRACRMNSV